MSNKRKENRRIENIRSPVVIAGIELKLKVYNGQRVVTFRDIDAVH